MDPFIIGLVFISTFMHAGWNLIVRGKRHEGVYFLRMLILVVGVGFIPTVISEAITFSITPKAWACVLVSGTCCGIYYLFLARSYSSGDFTVVYPIARAIPVLMVSVGDVLRGRNPTTMGWLGMVLVVLGCVFVPLISFRHISIRRYWNRTSLYMFLTALGTVGYTLFDKIASEIISKGPATAARYGYVFFVVSLLVYAAGTRAHKLEDGRETGIGWTGPALAGSLNFGAYWLVLWAYQLGQHASYIVAFRQFSIVIGVVLAFAIFKEQGRVVRLSGTFLITAGLAIIGLWG